MIKHILLTFTLFLSGIYAFSQNTTVSGVVLNEQNEQIPFVTVVEKGQKNGVVTDLKGNYSITLIDTSKAILIFSFSGSAKSEIPVNGRKFVDVLSIEMERIDEDDIVWWTKITKVDYEVLVSAMD